MQERPLPQWLLNLEAKKRARRAKDASRLSFASCSSVSTCFARDTSSRSSRASIFVLFYSALERVFFLQRLYRSSAKRSFIYG